MPLEPTYMTYPGTLVPSTGAALYGAANVGGALAPVIPAGESDSGLPGSKEQPTNFVNDLLAPTYRKYPYPPVVLLQPQQPTPAPAPEPREPTTTTPTTRSTERLAVP